MTICEIYMLNFYRRTQIYPLAYQHFAECIQNIFIAFIYEKKYSFLYLPPKYGLKTTSNTSTKANPDHIFAGLPSIIMKKL